jgi:antitoxin (DNA-binding transcriptional repressor) of toxin-antitoxin stability system
MRKLDIQKFVEARGSRDVQELRERIEELLQILKEDEPAEVIEDGKVIKHIVSPSETNQSREQRVKAFWKRIDELAAEVGSHLPEDAKINAAEDFSTLKR